MPSPSFVEPYLSCLLVEINIKKMKTDSLISWDDNQNFIQKLDLLPSSLSLHPISSQNGTALCNGNKYSQSSITRSGYNDRIAEQKKLLNHHKHGMSGWANSQRQKRKKKRKSQNSIAESGLARDYNNWEQKSHEDKSTQGVKQGWWRGSVWRAAMNES